MPGSFPHSVYSRHVLQPAYADAQAHLFAPMLDAHDAHAVMLAECGIITAENAAAIVHAVAAIRAAGVEQYAYQPGIEDLFFRIEGEIIALVGPDYGGNLQLARSRNDLGHALARMALRTRVLAVSDCVLTLRTVIMAQARRHLDTLMPGYTHTQPAQPVTFAHYLAGVLTFLAHDQAKFADAYAAANASPLGAAALTGTGFPIDRQRVADLLGFDGIVLSTQHAIGGGEYLTDTAFAVQALAVDLSRMTHDLLVRATQEANALQIDNSFIQISSIMPQKRNPVVLEHLRARLSRALGYAQTVVTQCHNIPYGDTQDIEDEILPPLFHALATIEECLELYTAFFETLLLNEEHLRARAGEGFTTATELADTLVRETRLPFRLAHKTVAGMVQSAVKAGVPSSRLTLAMLQTSAHEVLGHALDLSAAQFQQALDPEHFVQVRSGPGGVAPAATAVVLDDLQQALDTGAAWLAAAQTRLATAAARRAGAIEQQ
ncbi:argininosuccinate lyase [Caldilinea sp.]|uniref:argininosuccinate lyase n=1 Tax=Caldilinea sp. TaxID=2293560 RepID=UPI002B7C8EBD|nr:argininosuccinate lyase [Caldilinea sp.]HRA65628.1 argininosuccinate lyase [Caldilinea sp.]